MTLTTAQRDRACGVLLASAAGDALGAPYEFRPPRGPELPVGMVGGGSFGWEPGEWTDDTSMAVAIARVAATGAELCSEKAQDKIVACWHGIAGALLGGVHGASAVPAAWRRVLHGWPGLHARDLVAMAASIADHGATDRFDYSYQRLGQRGARAQHPYDDGLWLGGIDALRSLPPGVDAVVSLCRIGPADLQTSGELIEVRLIDRNGAQQNPNLGFVLNDTVSLIEDLRGEGRTVLLHCVQAHSRTPAVAALYGARRRGVAVDAALADIRAVLPHADPNDSFRDALRATETR